MKIKILFFFASLFYPILAFADSTSSGFGFDLFDIISVLAIIFSAYLVFKIEQLSKDSTLKSFKEKRYYHLNELFGQYLGTIDGIFQKDMRILNGTHILPTDNNFEENIKKTSREYEERFSMVQTSTILYRKIELFGLEKHPEADVLKRYFSLVARFFITQITTIQNQKIYQDGIKQCIENFNDLIMPIQNAMKAILKREWEEIESSKKPIELNARWISIFLTTVYIIILILLFIKTVQ